MRKTLMVLTGALLLCSVGVVLENVAATADTTLADIAGYRQWNRLNEKPITVTNSFSGGD
jgi:hypothetical protein